MKTITLEAPAKINLTLDILGRRADGYHDLRMVMQSVSLGDTVTVTETGDGFALLAEGIALPLLQLGLPDAFQHHASREDLLAEAGLDEAGIRSAVLKRWPDLQHPGSTAGASARTAAGGA